MFVTSIIYNQNYYFDFFPRLKSILTSQKKIAFFVLSFKNSTTFSYQIFFLFTRNFIKNSYANLILLDSNFQNKKTSSEVFYPFLRKGKNVFGSTKCKFCMYKNTSCYTNFRIQKFHLDYSILDQLGLLILVQFRSFDIWNFVYFFR